MNGLRLPFSPLKVVWTLFRYGLGQGQGRNNDTLSSTDQLDHCFSPDPTCNLAPIHCLHLFLEVQSTPKDHDLAA